MRAPNMGRSHELPGQPAAGDRDRLGTRRGGIADDLGDYADGSIRESVNSIVGIRHLIAHGRSANISVGRVTQYFEDAKKLARKMEDLLQ